MLTSSRFSTLLLGAVLAATAAGPAAAEEWTRPTVNGGEIDRSVTNQGNGVYSSSTSRTGAGGGTYTSSATCASGIVARCSRSYSGVTAGGKSFSGQRLAAYGPFHTRSAAAFTGPSGNTWHNFRRFRR